MTDEKLMRKAKKRAKEKREFRYFVKLFGLINIFILIFWFVLRHFYQNIFFFPIFSIMGCGVALFVIGSNDLFRPRKSLEEETQAEYERLKKENING
jgi:hypothetical protein